MIDIKDISGNIRFSTPINTGSKRKFTLQKEDYITLKFSLTTPMYFKLGDWVDDSRFGRFELCDLYKPTYNETTGGYDYELRLDAYYWKWKNKIFKFTPETGGQEASWNHTATLDAQMGVFLRNLKALGYKHKDTDFTIAIDNTVENSSKPMSYDKTNLLDALTKIAEAWECEWWITDSIIHFGRCEYGDPVDFDLSKNVDSMTRSDSRTNFATRVYTFGSTRNLPSDYRPIDESIVVNDVVQKRLMLPSGTPYIDAYPNMSTEEAIEDVVVFDDVYPRRVGMVSNVTTHEYTDVIKEEGKPDVVKKWNAYRFKDSGITFSEEYRLERQDLEITFQSGSLNGMTFGVIFNPCDKDGGETPIPEKNEDGTLNPDAQVWEIVRNEDYVRPLPDGVMIPEDGDTYVLSGFDTKFVSDTMIPEAEKELKEKAEKYIAKSKIDPSTYECKMMSDYIYGINPETGESDTLYAMHFELGDRINLINTAFFDTGNRQSRIIGFEYNLDIPYDSPVYTIGETASYSRLGDMENKIESLTYQGQTYTSKGGGGVYVIGTNDSTVATNRNVFSALKTLAMFIRKDIADIVTGIITFLNGIRIGNFVTGMIGGSGAAITVDKSGKTKLEIDKIEAREELIVPKITFNCIDVISGDKANTFAFGTIKNVDQETRIAELDLLEDQTGTLHASDICRGVFHNLEGNNQPNDTYDTNGYLNYAGFSTSYFTPTEILESKPGKMTFRYALQSGTSVHPMKSMNFFAYGNFTDKDRQAITYENRYYTRRLKNVNTWMIHPDKHIAMQDGLLEGLTIGGMIMHGHGTYMENCYFTGAQIQFTPQQKEELAGQDAYSVNLSTYESVIVVDDDNNITGGYSEEKYVTSGQNYVLSGDRQVTAMLSKIKTRIQAFRGSKELFYSKEYHEDSYQVTLHTVGCVATVDNGIVSINQITDFDNCHIEITVNCEGNSIFEKHYKVTAVRNGTSSVVADLDNEMTSVACDAGGNVLSGLPISTNLTMWYGEKELPIEKIQLELPTGVTATSDNATVTVTTITKDAPSNLQIGITAHTTYGGNPYRKHLSFVVNKVMPGTDGSNAVIYELLTNTNSVKIDENGNYSEASLTCSVVKTDGNTTEVLSSLPSDMSIKYSADGNTEVFYTYQSPVILNGKRKNIKFNLYRNGTLLDTENIPIIIDGRSNVTADLDNEMDSVACDVSGTVLSGLPVRTHAMMWYGDKPLPLDKIELPSIPGITSSANKDTGIIEVTGITKDASITTSIPITLYATYAGSPYTRSLTLTVNKILPGANGETPVVYQLLPSATSVRLDKTGNYTPSVVSCAVTATTGAETVTLSTLPGGLTMQYATSEGGEKKTYTYKSNLSPESGTILFYLLNSSETIDKETIHVIREGTDGTPGQDGQPGRDGTYLKQIFMQSDVRPLTPEITTRVPDGWSENVEFGELTILGYDGEFFLDGTGRRSPKSPLDNKQYKDKVRFKTTRNNQVVALRVYVTSETNYDWIYIGRYDSAVSTGNYQERYSGQNTIRVLQTIPSPGEHYIELIYHKDSSGSSGGDFGRYTIVNSNTIWVSSAQAVFDRTTGIWVYGTWSQPVKYLADTPDVEYVFRRAETPFTPESDPYQDKYLPLPFAASDDYRGAYDSTLAQVAGGIYEIVNSYYRCIKNRPANAPETIINKEYFTYIENFTDSPMGVSEERPVEYVCTRKKKDGLWGPFSYPAPYAKYAKGADGESGPMPVYCGMFTAGVTYVYDKNERDIINYEIDGGVFTFQVKEPNSAVTVPPTSSVGDSKWEVASKFKFVAMDTALIDGADIAGFIYKDKKMRSRDTLSDGTPMLLFDGKTGEIVANKAKIRGDIKAESGEIGGFGIDGYNLKNVNNRDCWININYTEESSKRVASLGNNISSVAGFQTSGYFEASNFKENYALILKAAGGTPDFNGFNRNYAIKATGGCDWNIGENDYWRMPGLLGIIQVTMTYSNNTYIHSTSRLWGNGFNLSNPPLSVDTRNMLMTVNHNLGHTKYWVVPSFYGPDARYGRWGLMGQIEGYNSNSFTCSVWSTDNNKFYPTNMMFLVFGIPSIK